jgi:hypothetical protein
VQTQLTWVALHGRHASALFTPCGLCVSLSHAASACLPPADFFSPSSTTHPTPASACQPLRTLRSLSHAASACLPPADCFSPSSTAHPAPTCQCLPASFSTHCAPRAPCPQTSSRRHFGVHRLNCDFCAQRRAEQKSSASQSSREVAKHPCTIINRGSCGDPRVSRRPNFPSTTQRSSHRSHLASLAAHQLFVLSINSAKYRRQFSSSRLHDTPAHSRSRDGPPVCGLRTHSTCMTKQNAASKILPR